MSGFEIRKSGMKEYLLDIFFPNKCPFCDSAIRWDLYCCDECFESAVWSDKNGYLLCPVCGRAGCVCGKEKLHFDRCVAAGIYDDYIISSAVLALKYRGDRNAAGVFSYRLCEMIEKIACEKYDYIVPVPMSNRRRRIRGYNQSELIAQALSLRMNIPVRTDLLFRKFSFLSQHKRTAEERRAASEAEYKWVGKLEIPDDRIILCDDIMTTGSTIDYCAYLLKQHGAAFVTAAVCARTV